MGAAGASQDQGRGGTGPRPYRSGGNESRASLRDAEAVEVPRRRFAAGRRRSRLRRDRVTDGDGVVVHQDLLDQQAGDSLAVTDVHSLRRLLQALEESGQCLGQSAGMTCGRRPDRGSPAARLGVPVRGPAVRACGAPQFVQRQEIFLVGGQQAFDTFADAREVAFDSVLPFLRRLARPGRIKATVQLSGDEPRILDQPNDLLPHDVVEQILADRAAVANGTAEMAPAILTQAAVIVDFAELRVDVR